MTAVFYPLNRLNIRSHDLQQDNCEKLFSWRNSNFSSTLIASFSSNIADCFFFFLHYWESHVNLCSHVCICICKLNHTLFTVVLHYLLTMMRMFKVLFVLSELILPKEFMSLFSFNTGNILEHWPLLLMQNNVALDNTLNAKDSRNFALQ